MTLDFHTLTIADREARQVLNSPREMKSSSI